MKTISIVAALVAATAAAPAFASCGCTLTSDWLSQGLVAQPGTTIGLRFDYIPQTDLQSGTAPVDRGKVAVPPDREIEKYTDNHYVTASFDRQFDADWGVNVQVPYIYRPHATLSEDDTTPSYSHTQGIGDVRITARWQGFRIRGSINGIQAGLILPTGEFHQTFRSGPERGEEVDRGLQPGYGTLEAVLGYYRYGKLAGNVDYILQVQGQIALDNRDLYRPGDVGQVSAGVHYTRWRGITPQVQLSFRATARDSGANSDRENSGGEQLYVSPGVIANLGKRISAFTYVQLPIYQRVGGYQITPRYTVSTGLQLRL